MARNAGFATYRDYALKLRKRFDYGVSECETFHAAVEKVVVPLFRARQERRRQKMGLDRLRPWDLAVDAEGRPALQPFTTADQLVAGALAIFGRINPELARRFEFMIAHELLDLESRKGKAPGAYSHSLEEKRIPFIFMNAVGLDHDLKTILHEFGHSFHTFMTQTEPLVFYRYCPLEFCEVASMSMEFLGLDHLDVFYSPAEAARSREQRLEEVLWLFCWVATIDAFQHWIYTHPAADAEARAGAWLSLLERFGGIEDWSGYEEAKKYAWHRQLHIFEIPFYYIEYAIAELGALQVWAQAKRDPLAAFRAYRSALSLGGARRLPDLFAAAGATFDLGSSTLAPLIAMVSAELEKVY
jgi:oligoendopeptidase F